MLMVLLIELYICLDDHYLYSTLLFPIIPIIPKNHEETKCGKLRLRRYDSRALYTDSAAGAWVFMAGTGGMADGKRAARHTGGPHVGTGG